MKVPNINHIQIRPTDKKMKQAKRTIDSISSGLPKEMPIEKEVHILTPTEIMDSIKNKIQISIDNMTRGKS